MALDTDSNFTVTGYTGEASVATDFSAADSAHYQVVKVAYGDTADFERVTASQGLPVSLIDVPATININTITNPVTVGGSVSVFGIAGATAIGVTASDLDIRNLTAGSVTAGNPSTSTVDIVRVVGYSGGWAVGVTATDLDIRNLSAGSQVTVGDPSVSSVDIVRVVGYSGGYPIGVSATDLDIRNLTSTSDSVSVFGGVTVSNGQGNPYDAGGQLVGFGTRILRATKDPVPYTSISPFISAVSSDASFDDTVRVVGLSGAYPVDVLGIGVTNIADRSTRVPFHVDDTGALYVNLASGTINVTASVSSSAFTLAGVSLAGATTAAETIQVRGYTGPGAVPIEVTGNSFGIRGLSATIDSVYANIRALTAGDQVDLGGTAGLIMERFNSAFFRNNDTGLYQLKTDDVSGSLILTELNEQKIGIKALTSNIDSNLNSNYKITGAGTNVVGETSFDSGANALRVVVANVVQPDGITSGRIPISAGSATQMSSHVLKSGVHFKSDLGNSNATIFIGSNNQNQIGYPLYNGDQIFIETDNTNKIFYSATAGATLYYMGT